MQLYVCNRFDKTYGHTIRRVSNQKGGPSGLSKSILEPRSQNSNRTRPAITNPSLPFKWRSDQAKSATGNFGNRGSDNPSQFTQSGVLSFGLHVDGNVGISVFPEGKEILIRLAGQPAPSFTFLMRTTSLIQLPREMTRRFSGDTSNAKMIWSESKFVILLGAPPASGIDQMFATPPSFREYRIDLPSAAHRNRTILAGRDWHSKLLHLSSSDGNDRRPFVGIFSMGVSPEQYVFSVWRNTRARVLRNIVGWIELV